MTDALSACIVLYETTSVSDDLWNARELKMNK
jgi:hypothetical protein